MGAYSGCSPGLKQVGMHSIIWSNRPSLKKATEYRSLLDTGEMTRCNVEVYMLFVHLSEEWLSYTRLWDRGYSPIISPILTTNASLTGVTLCHDCVGL